MWPRAMRSTTRAFRETPRACGGSSTISNPAMRLTAADTDSSARRFLMLGGYLGHQHGAAELHGLVERADNDLEQLHVLSGRIHEEVAWVMSPANPIYTVLHEAAYSSGPATRWAAERARLADPRFALDAQPAPYFTGEAVFPWMLEELGELQAAARSR